MYDILDRIIKNVYCDDFIGFIYIKEKSKY